MTQESLIRLGLFLLAFIVLALWETLCPRRPLNFSRPQRWFSNLSLSLLNQLALRLCFPVLAMGFALVAQQRGWGLFNIIGAPAVVAIVICFVLLDFAIYIQHRVFHRVQWLWRLHRVHHTDMDFDVTTAVRFHPVEIVLSMAIKMTLVVLLGVPPETVLAFELVLNFTALFNHSNISIPLKLDRLLRLIVVTPDMHRVHHSVIPAETDSNFGFNLPWWDYLLKTYCAQPAQGHHGMTLGLEEYRREDELSLPRLLLQPFRKP